MLWFWNASTRTPSMSLTLIILVESGLIMSDENQMEVTLCTRHKKVCRMREFIPCVVSGAKLMFIFLEMVDKPLLIHHHILTFMIVNIHPTILHKSPAQTDGQVVCSAHSN